MKYLFLLLLAAAATFTASAQSAVPLDSVSQHIGDSVTTKGVIFGVRYFPNGKGSPTLVNIGAAYPNQVLTVVIPQDVRNAMAIPPSEATLKGKTVLIRGKVELYKDKPQVVINHPSQLQVIDEKGEVLPFH